MNMILPLKYGIMLYKNESINPKSKTKAKNPKNDIPTIIIMDMLNIAPTIIKTTAATDSSKKLLAIQSTIFSIIASSF
ncbi:MAG: hypothetical protein B7Y13_05205 [Sulfurovum sp. 24-42-9]|nr:MAG: hypothetical protein B7Y63_04585 [Sulfurovum sp. 35-42-20]OYZ49286.1 MAG: hypothetical protein B7Y13_05205 [Sulfurovum sp. 24-42-9]